MRTVRILERIDGLTAIVRRIDEFAAAGDEIGVRWEMANLRLVLKWFAQDLEMELAASAE